MIAINLLPWRAMVREEIVKQRKLFLIVFGGLLLLGLITHMGCRFVLQTVDTRIDDLQNQLTELTNQTQQKHFDPALLIIDKIHSSQMELIHFFKIVSRSMIDHVVWSEIVSQKNHIAVTGNTDSFSILSKFVTSYNLANKLLVMTIMNVKNNANFSGVSFRLQLTRAASPFMNQTKNDDAIA